MSCTNLRVKELLKERGWTTKVLAEKTGMSESYLTHIKNSTRRWNEDSLKKIAEAFGVEPISLLMSYKSNEIKSDKNDFPEEESVDNENKLLLSIKKIPMVGDIPSYPSDYNNKIVQITSGYKEMFVPVLGEVGGATFCFVVENQFMAPRFMKGDCLIVVPGVTVKSGDIVAVEYKTDKIYKQIVTINFSDTLVMFGHVSYKQPPVALLKNRDYFRVIGKVDQVYQKYA